MATTTTNYGLTKPAYSDTADIADINGNMDTIDGVLQGQADALGIVVDGDKTAYSSGAAIGQYIILKNSTITGCDDGLYTAAKAIPYNTAIDSTYLTAVVGGGLNSLNSKMLQYIDVSDSGSIGTSVSDAYPCIFTLPQGKVPISAMIVDSGSDTSGYCIAMNPTRRTSADTANENGWISRIISSYAGSHTFTVRIFYK